MNKELREIKLKRIAEFFNEMAQEEEDSMQRVGKDALMYDYHEGRADAYKNCADYMTRATQVLRL